MSIVSAVSIISHQRKLIDKLEKYIINQNGNYSNNQVSLKEKILFEVSNRFNVSPSILINSKKRGVVNQARVMAMILLNKHLDVIQKDIARMFKKKISLVNMRINVFNKIITNNPNLYVTQKQYEKMYSEEFVSTYNCINKKIIEFKKQQPH